MARKHDMNVLAHHIMEQATNDANETIPVRGRPGGLQGGQARAQALTSTQRKEIAKKAAAARWHKQRTNNPN